MFFIAFFIQTKEHRVVPYKWIRGVQYEQLINYGLNPHRKFNAFWTDNKDAFDENGVARCNYPVNLDANGTIFPNEGWYLCHIKRFKGIIFIESSIELFILC